ncbi:delta-aminolevulinic acid dehydratase [Leptolyngbya sp. Heron Island J]|uniref:delta-aminolevulinic acid dehydratase n=1 Tax=Leptolyngbya sp. Heron Island J TaxID=1385935 RepID=UPI0003B9DA9C|nr:delta-aminolevulinic acid dehydratase [Leptolyngbya sp. Heron Island J]ESA31943.1 delta-aminolevulinic acid dehydratase [Leptolyngbya sp. Heron Island J]
MAPTSALPQTATDAVETIREAVSTDNILAKVHRPRRLRRMVQETVVLTAADLIYPLFIMEGEGQKEAVPSIPNCFRDSLDLLLEEANAVWELGIGAIALFPLILHHQKDNAGTVSMTVSAFFDLLSGPSIFTVQLAFFYWHGSRPIPASWRYKPMF